uniref:Pre-mRNA polyadenylation factor Fip1 domain-containing protein n=1 Tax=Melanopsichium pennsylvanicum 4 TaxID=1398559 RepID=A0A077R4Z8_9BASI|nr:uncharacterized protein BN887_05733 [Melanopsichium pennsylvanicum 4]
MDDDDDAFLYGDEPAAPITSVGPTNGATSIPASETKASAGADTNSTAKDAQECNSDGNSDEDEDEGDDDDSDSDSDIEFIIDASIEAQQPPARPGNFPRPGAPGTRPLPNQSTPQRPQSTLTSEYTPLSRSQLLAAANPNASPTTADAVAQPPGTPSLGVQPGPPGAPPIKPSTSIEADGLGPEGPPPRVPSTAPRLNLSPDPEDRAYPKPGDIVEEEEASSTDIFDIDLDALPDKPWRRYGADLTDYFNYGFNEESWSLWRGKKESMTDARKNAESHMFNGGNGMGANGDVMQNMQQMMNMMPPMPPHGMMPPEQMMAMMAGMGMPPMPGMPSMPPQGMPQMSGNARPGMNPMMIPNMFPGQQSNSGGPGNDPSQRVGTSIRGRAAAAANNTSGQTSRPGRAVSPTLPPNVPSGPKNPGKRYNDRDNGAGAAGDLLDYGATAGIGGGGGDEGDEWDNKDRGGDGETKGKGGWDSPPSAPSRRSVKSAGRREGTFDHHHHHHEQHHDSNGANGNNKDNKEGYGSRRGAGGGTSSSRSSKRATGGGDVESGGGVGWDNDETASQTSASGKGRSKRSSHPASRGSRKRSAPEDRDDGEDASAKAATKKGGGSSRSGKGGSRKKR